MSAFREKDAEFFFGRETFVDGLVRVVQQQRLVTVIGPSGSGKSSVVLAGLIPKLREEGSWLIESFRPNKQPFYELAAALIGLLEPELGKTDKNIKAKELAESIRKHGFTADVSAILKENPGKRLLLAIDQFEELYTGCADTEQQQFVDALLAAVESASRTVTLVLTLRADFYSYVVNYPRFTEALNKYPAQNLSPMKAQEMQAAIERPAQKMNLKLEEKLTQRILDDVKQEPGNLPLLEFALTQLWEKQSRGRLTHQAYSEIGGVAKGLSNHAEAVYGKLSQGEQKQAQRIFLQLVRPGEGTEHTRRVATRGEVGEECWELIRSTDGLASARLVVTGHNEATGEETVEVVHEALIREWGRLQEWIEDDRAFLTWRDQLRVTIAQWNTDKDEEILLRGKPLADAEAWLQERAEDLTNEREYIQQSLQLRKREKDEKERQELEKLEAQVALDTATERNQILTDANQKAKNKIRYSNIYLAVSAFLCAVFLGLAAIAIHKQQEAQDGTQLEQQTNSIIREFPNNQIKALLSAIQAGQKLKGKVKDGRPIKDYPTIRPISVLGEILDKIQQQNEFDTGHKIVKSVSFSPDSKYITTAGEDGTVRLWNLSGQEIRKIQAHDGSINGANDVSFSPDGKIIATSGEDGKAKLWDLSGNLIITLLEEKEGGIKSVSFSPDGQKLATSGDYGIARIWDLSGKQLATLKGYKAITIKNITFSPDNKTIATAGDDGTVRLWDLSGKQISQIIPHKGKPVYSVRFSPDGKLFATAGGDNIPRIWNLLGQEQRKLEGHNEIVTFVSFSPDGKRLVTTSEDGTARVWDAASGKEIYRFQGHERTVLTASFSPDGKYIATAGKDGKTRIWNLLNQGTTQFKGHVDDVNTLSISPNDNKKLMASGDNFGVVRFWDLSGKPIGRELKANDRGGRILSVNFSSDGSYIATGGEESYAKIWDSSKRELKTKLKGNYSWISSISFSSDRKYIATAGANQPPKIWNWDGTEITTLEGHQGLVYQVSFHPEKKMIATAAWDGTIGLWNFYGNKVNKIKIFKGHQANIGSLSFSPDGEQIATADDNSNVKVWDLSGKELLNFFSYQRGVQGIAFSPNGESIATGGKDGTVKVWDFQGRQLAAFMIEKGSVWDVSFSSDGKAIVASGDKGSLQLFKFRQLDELLTEGCNWLKGYKYASKVCLNK